MGNSIIVRPSGNLVTIYGEEFELRSLGEIHISRASYVEPDVVGNWTADLTPVGGPILGGFASRSQAIAAEINWLKSWLVAASQ